MILGIKKVIVQNQEDEIRQIIIHPEDLMEIWITVEKEVTGEKTLGNSRTNWKERENWKRKRLFLHYDGSHTPYSDAKESMPENVPDVKGLGFIIVAFVLTLKGMLSLGS